MALRNIFLEGEDILKKKCRPVGEVDDRIREMLDDMLETMRANEGVGIAAPQVGLLKRMCVMEPEPDRVYYLVDPEITGTSGEQVCYEGCLSVPGYVGKVKRPLSMKVTAAGRDGERHQYVFTDFEAIVASHEIDHLDGILYTSKAADLHRPEDREVLEGSEEEASR